METKLYGTSSLVERDRATVWHPFRQMETECYSIPITHANGVYLYAEDGKRYLDAISSWWVNLHGHGHPYIAEKIAAQARRLEHVIFASFTHEPAVQLAERLLTILPGTMSKVFYSDNGSTAVEASIKMAFQYWYNRGQPKSKVVCFNHSYHGDTFGAMSVAGKNGFNRPFWNHLFDVERIDAPFLGQENAALKQLRTIVEKGDVACFIFEPLVLGAGGMLIYPPEGLNSLLTYCREHKVLTIADEVMTGFGRTGTLFACDRLTEEVDMICLSKGLTGGFLPLGATVCKQEIYDAFLGQDMQRAFLHGHSYCANPIACVSALASLDLLCDPNCTQQREMISRSHQSFCQKWRHHPMLKRCESIGTILALEYHAETHSYFSSIRDSLSQYFLSQGVVLRPFGNMVHLMPPYCIQYDELEFVYEVITNTFDKEICNFSKSHGM